MPQRVAVRDGGVVRAAFVIQWQPIAHARSAGISAPRGSAVGRTEVLSARALRGSTSGLGVGAAGRTDPHAASRVPLSAVPTIGRRVRLRRKAANVGAAASRQLSGVHTVHPEQTDPHRPDVGGPGNSAQPTRQTSVQKYGGHRPDTFRPPSSRPFTPPSPLKHQAKSTGGRHSELSISRRRSRGNDPACGGHPERPSGSPAVPSTWMAARRL